MPPDAIAASAREAGLSAESRPGIEEALGAIARFDFDPPPRILITGTLYLAGDVLALNGTVPA